MLTITVECKGFLPETLRLPAPAAEGEETRGRDDQRGLRRGQPLIPLPSDRTATLPEEFRMFLLNKLGPVISEEIVWGEKLPKEFATASPTDGAMSRLRGNAAGEEDGKMKGSRYRRETPISETREPVESFTSPASFLHDSAMLYSSRDATPETSEDAGTGYKNSSRHRADLSEDEGRPGEERANRSRSKSEERDDPADRGRRGFDAERRATERRRIEGLNVSEGEKEARTNVGIPISFRSKTLRSDSETTRSWNPDAEGGLLSRRLPKSWLNRQRAALGLDKKEKKKTPVARVKRKARRKKNEDKSSQWKMLMKMPLMTGLELLGVHSEFRETNDVNRPQAVVCGLASRSPVRLSAGSLSSSINLSGS